MEEPKVGDYVLLHRTVLLRPKNVTSDLGTVVGKLGKDFYILSQDTLDNIFINYSARRIDFTVVTKESHPELFV